jgi:hypothetical protein
VLGANNRLNNNKEVIMKRIKCALFIALALTVSTSFAARNVKSKLGDIDLSSAKDGGTTVCTAGFNDELTILKESDSKVLVKGHCGQGWVDKSKVEYIAKGPGDKSITLDEQILVGWIDNPSAVFVLEGNDIDFDGVNIDRDFKEYLTYTMDREETEMRHGEN